MLACKCLRIGKRCKPRRAESRSPCNDEAADAPAAAKRRSRHHAASRCSGHAGCRTEKERSISPDLGRCDCHCDVQDRHSDNARGKAVLVSLHQQASPLYDDHSHAAGQVRRIFRPHFASALTPMVPSHKGPLVEHWTPTMIYVPTHGRHHAVSCQLVIADAPSCAHRRPVGGFGDEAMQRLTRRLHQPCSIRIALDSTFLSSAAEQQRGTMRRGRS